MDAVEAIAVGSSEELFLALDRRALRVGHPH